MAILRWLAVTLFNWLFGRIVIAIQEYIKDKQAEAASKKENARAIEELKKAQTEKERRDANADITRDSF